MPSCPTTSPANLDQPGQPDQLNRRKQPGHPGKMSLVDPRSAKGRASNCLESEGYLQIYTATCPAANHVRSAGRSATQINANVETLTTVDTDALAVLREDRGQNYVHHVIDHAERYAEKQCRRSCRTA